MFLYRAITEVVNILQEDGRSDRIIKIREDSTIRNGIKATLIMIVC